MHAMIVYHSCEIVTTCDREELLDEVKAERLARGDAKKRSSSAASIQRHWRGHAARRSMQARLASAFISDFSPMVSSAQYQIPAEDVPMRLLPPVLFLLLRPSMRAGRPQTAWERSAPLRLMQGGGRGTGRDSAHTVPSLLQVDMVILSMNNLFSRRHSSSRRLFAKVGGEMPPCSSYEVSNQRGRFDVFPGVVSVTGRCNRDDQEGSFDLYP